MTDNTNDTLKTLEQTAVDHLTADDSAPTPPAAARRYDFTALSTAATCPRKYVFEHVHGLPGDLAPAGDAAVGPAEAPGRVTDPAQAVREGQLFHTVVEQCWPSNAPKTDWKDRAAALASTRGWYDALPRVETLVDAFFRSPTSRWDVDSSRVEVPFSFTFEGREITGIIDALPRRPDAGPLVLDHKTGRHEPAEEQLLIYLLATYCDEDLPVDHAPTDAAFLRAEGREFRLDRLDITDIDETLARAQEVLREWIKAADAARADTPNPGSHCSSCSYRDVCDAAETR